MKASGLIGDKAIATGHAEDESVKNKSTSALKIAKHLRW